MARASLAALRQASSHLPPPPPPGFPWTAASAAAGGAPRAWPHPRRAVVLPTEAHTEHLGHVLGEAAQRGTVVLLKGGLGVGKSVLARGFVRGALGADHADVTSPTYLLDNVYASRSGVLVHHMDLYRLAGAADAAALGLPHIFEQHISVIEWPQRLVEAAAAAAPGSSHAERGSNSSGSPAPPTTASPSAAAPAAAAGALPPEYLLVHLVTEGEPEWGEHAPQPQSQSAQAPSPSPSSSHVLDSILNGHGHTPVGGGAGATALPLHPHGPPHHHVYEVFEDTQARLAVLYARGRRYEALLDALAGALAEAPPARQLR